MSSKTTLYLRILVSAFTAESQALKSTGGTMAAERTWYNGHIADIIPAHTGFRVYRGKPGAKIRRRLMAAQRT